MVGIPVTIASRFVTIINVIPIKTIGMISQISVYPKLLPSIAAVVIAPEPITIPVAINPGQFFLSDPLMEAVQHLPQILLLSCFP